MSGLAKYLLSLGKKVGGSDIISNEYTEELINLGAHVSIEPVIDSVANYQLIIYTDAVKDTDTRICEARNLSKEIISRGQFLYEISREFGKVIAVSGCHGKTTCSAMLTHIFAVSGKKFASHIGGGDIAYSNFYYCCNDFFITEACEYKKNFLLLKPDIAVILNSDADHLECYGSEAELKRAYLRFADSAGIAVTLYRDLPISYGPHFGFDKSADYYAKNIKNSEGAYSFSLYENNAELGTVRLNVYGKHNVLNALAAVAAARSAGINFADISKGLASFSGVKRRFEIIGKVNGAKFIADYAHHPNELRAVLRTAQKLTPEKLYVVFQPHTYSRTKNLFKHFVKVLSHLNNLMIYKTFAAREYYDDEGSALTLSQSLKKSRYGDCVYDIRDFVLRAGKGDTILFLGAGDIYDLAKQCIVIDKI